jgi:hypothetical protein
LAARRCTKRSRSPRRSTCHCWLALCCFEFQNSSLPRPGNRCIWRERVYY